MGHPRTLSALPPTPPPPPTQLATTIDYDNRHQYRDHRMQQNHHQPTAYSYTTSLLEMLLLSTMLSPMAGALWTSEAQFSSAILFSTPPSTIGKSSSSVALTAHRRMQPPVENVDAAGNRWSVKHKSLPTSRRFPVDGESKTIGKFNFTSRTATTPTVSERRTHRITSSSVAASFTAGARLESHLPFNEIIL
ncbi:hypothetical protein ZHAS_00012063 [Anopheles sinensis]|uniref:Uncharacterized protein n=1 Tax=Anopheles sinensis TaxID=74873 RepID=A0A084W1U0_ANOSI|nr:hypothetical protein ZHAS_00012063 [Anopheles sinensis]